MDVMVFQKQYNKDDFHCNITISIFGNPLTGDIKWAVVANNAGADNGFSGEGQGMTLSPALFMQAIAEANLDIKTTTDLLYFFGQMVAACDTQGWGGNFDIVELNGYVDPPFDEDGEYIASGNNNTPQSLDDL